MSDSFVSLLRRLARIVAHRLRRRRQADRSPLAWRTRQLVALSLLVVTITLLLWQRSSYPIARRGASFSHSLGAVRRAGSTVPTAALAQHLADSGWPKAHGNAANSGVCPRGPSPHATERWRFDHAARIHASALPALGADGALFFMDVEGTAVAVEGTTGRKRWEFGTKGAGYCSPVVASNGLVYFGSAKPAEEAHIIALDQQTGRPRWHATCGKGLVSALSLGPDGDVFAGSWNGRLVKLDGRTGETLWRFATPAWGISACPAISDNDGTVYLASTCTLYAINGRTGRQQWRFHARYRLQSPVLGTDTVYVHDNARIYAVDRQTGRERWQFVAGEQLFIVGPLALWNETLFFGISQYAPGEGGPQEERQTGERTTALKIATKDASHEKTEGKSTDRRGHLFALRASDGALLWKQKINPYGHLFGGPVVSARDRLVFIQDGNRVFALNAVTGDRCFDLDTGTTALPRDLVLDKRGNLFLTGWQTIRAFR